MLVGPSEFRATISELDAVLNGLHRIEESVIRRSPRHRPPRLAETLGEFRYRRTSRWGEESTSPKNPGGRQVVVAKVAQTFGGANSSETLGEFRYIERAERIPTRRLLDRKILSDADFVAKLADFRPCPSKPRRNSWRVSLQVESRSGLGTESRRKTSWRQFRVRRCDRRRKPRTRPKLLASFATVHAERIPAPRNSWRVSLRRRRANNGSPKLLASFATSTPSEYRLPRN